MFYPCNFGVFCILHSLLFFLSKQTGENPSLQALIRLQSTSTIIYNTVGVGRVLIHHEVAESFELDVILNLLAHERLFDHGTRKNHLALLVDMSDPVLQGRGIFLHEQMVIQTDLRTSGFFAKLASSDPMHAAELLLLVGHGVLGLVLRKDGAADFHDLSGLVANHLFTADHVGVLQAQDLAGSEAEELGFILHLHVVLVHIEDLLVGEVTRALGGVLGEQGGLQDGEEVIGLVHQHQADGVEDGEGTRSHGLEMLSCEVLETRPVDGGHGGTSDRDVIAEVVDGLGSVATAAQALDGGHTRIVPAVDDSIHYHVLQLTLGHDGVGEIQTAELPHVRSPHIQLVDQPVVRFPSRFELQGAEGIVDVLDGVDETVLEVVGRVNTPFVAHVGVRDILDSVGDRVPHARIGTAHVYLHTKSGLALSELALAHIFEQSEVFFDGAVSPRRFGIQVFSSSFATAFLGDFSGSLDLFGGLVVDVGLSHLDELDGVLVELVEVVGAEVDLARLPSQPLDIFHDVVDEFKLLGLGVGVVKAENGLSFSVGYNE